MKRKIIKDEFELKLSITGNWVDLHPIDVTCWKCRGAKCIPEESKDDYDFGWPSHVTCPTCKGTGLVKRDRPLPKSVVGEKDCNINLDINDDISEFFEKLYEKYNDPNYKPKFRNASSNI